jgi:mono/diheme cytochrome c family protein
MKKIMRIVLGVLGSLVLLIALGALFIQLRGVPTYDAPTYAASVEPSPERHLRGKKLAGMLCANCHLNAETGTLSGKRMKDLPAEFGQVHAPNITQDPTYGIGKWTDGELIYLLRTGIKRDGAYAPPYMPKFPHMSDEDIASIVAFLRSDDPWVAAKPIASKKNTPSFLTKFLTNTVFKPLRMPETPIALPDTNNLVAFGRYLAINLDCWTCHSQDFKQLDLLHPENTPMFFAGGNTVFNEDGQALTTLNLTPHETGLGNWSEEKFIKALRYGLKEGEPALRYPMMPYSQLSERECKAIFAYLKTLPPLENKVVRSSL